MTPDQFVAKWKASARPESAAAQEHFIDLCRLLDESTPTEADPNGTFYAFEKGASKTTGASGWADVWKAGYFAWEYKGKGKDLNAAFSQLQQYAGALGNPPLLVVSDMAGWRTSRRRRRSPVFSRSIMSAPQQRQTLQKRWVRRKRRRR